MLTHGWKAQGEDRVGSSSNDHVIGTAGLRKLINRRVGLSIYLKTLIVVPPSLNSPFLGL
jgi:hypothetical protein